MFSVLLKAAHVQLVQGRAWGQLAHRQHFAANEVPAPRGLILDASGRTLATSREVVRLEVAPREIKDIRKLRRALLGIGVDQLWADRATDVRRNWVTLPEPYVAEDVARITAMRGVHVTPISDRAYSTSAGLRALLGHVDAGGGIEGLELALDTVLRGVNGTSRMVKDVSGRAFVSPKTPGEAPRPGNTLTLTINHGLQEIAERALSEAVAHMNAEGGDIVILDPRNGELLAVAAERHGVTAPAVTAVTEPFEPGSTLKPLIAAALMAQGKARSTDVVPTRHGSFQLHGRVIHDEPHPGRAPSSLSLAEVIRYSSNIGIAQFAERLTAREEFEALRDFGLGSPTLLPYSAESGGVLRPPRTWSRQTAASLAMGYEVSVTPLQLALAYSAIANGGELPEPALVREIRSPDGNVIFRSTRRVVRRVMPVEVAEELRRLLASVVERGTAVQADLAAYVLAGKTGTPRRSVDGRYAPMEYNPNFVGLFPADAPQLVVVVKLNNPKGNFFGGATAAPVTKTILQAALAARDAALNRAELTNSAKTATAAVRLASAGSVMSPLRVTTAAVPDSAQAVVIDLPRQSERRRLELSPRRVPSVRGMNLRAAVRSLHSAGLRVQLARDQSRESSRMMTEPAAGVVVSAGSVVRLRYR